MPLVSFPPNWIASHLSSHHVHMLHVTIEVVHPIHTPIHEADLPPPPELHHTTHRVITRTKFELRSETTYTEVDERTKAGEQYSKKTFYTEVEKRNQAQIYSY